ncbi:MAG: SAM-dependent chlorinase/fluorinase [Bacteroidota bacterium]|nr:SAM-dependent chlorinase/fluorinase [Bacteroidota bacterium]
MTRKKSKKVIALLTDFGIHDHYVGTMKGVILSIAPDARIVDISHDVEPQNVLEAGYLLWASYRYFPSGTIFVSVVDPGVGSSRRIIAIQTEHYTFIAPENGLLDYIISEEEIKDAVRIDSRSPSAIQKFFWNTPSGLTQISSTFHGRDVFAPLAAHLSCGVSLKELGAPATLKIAKSIFTAPDSSTDQARVIHVDHFGNLITSIRADDKQKSFDKTFCIIGRKRIARWIHFYNEAPSNTPCLIVGSSGLIEIVVRGKSAARLLSAHAGMNIHFRKNTSR